MSQLRKDKSSSLAQEIASRKTTRLSFGGMDLELPNPDPVLKKLGCDIQIYKDIKVDTSVKGATRRRRSAVVGLEYGLDQGNASDRVMKLCETVLSNVKLRPLIRALHDAAWYGYMPAEVYWQKSFLKGSGGLWLPEKVIGKPPEWFGFNDDNQLIYKGGMSLQPEPVPEMKFILARQDATFDNPYGVADMAAVYWYTVFRKGGLKFWLRFADKYGQAFVVGKHPRGTPQPEVDMILDSLEMLAQDGVAAIPNDGSVEILESGSKGATSNMFEGLLKYCRSEINIALLGQDQSTDASSTNASAQAGLEVTDDIRDADGEFIAEAINELLRYVVRLNIGDNEPMPKWSMWSEEDKTEQLAIRDEKLQKAGARLTKTYFMRAYKLAEDEVDVDAPLSANARTRGREARERGNASDASAGGTVSGAKADFAENSDKAPPPNLPLLGGGALTPLRLDFADATTAKLGRQSQPHVDAWLERIEATLANATDISHVPDLIALEFSELNPDVLVDVISTAMTAAQLAGRAEVVAEGE